MDPFLASTEPFTKLSAEEIGRLAATVKERRFARGEAIFREGEASGAVWLVKSGRVHVMRCLRGGKIATTCVMTSGEMFCCLSALDQKSYPADAVAAVDTTVLRIPASDFREAMAISPDFARETLDLFCERLRQLEEKGSMLYESAEQRLAQVLLGLSKKFGDTVPLTRQELAEIAGTTHETAIRALSRLGKQGVIRSSRGKVTIVSREKLSSLISPSV